MTEYKSEKCFQQRNHFYKDLRKRPRPMSLEITLLVLLAALLHASWNYLAKTIPSGAPFVWLLAVVMCIVWLPVSAGYIYLYGFDWTPQNIGILLVSGVLHLVYFVILQIGYQKADLSMVYPLARGSGPVFATLAAVVLLGEQISPMAIGGLSLVVVGVFLISGFFNSKPAGGRAKTGMIYGITIGLLIAGYTVWDGFVVREMAIAPILLEYSTNPLRIAALSPIAWKKWPEIRAIWTDHRWKILVISVIAPFGFILVLYAMKVAPIHLVAPTREISIVLGVIFGAKLLTEENFRSRLAGAMLIVTGIVFLSQ